MIHSLISYINLQFFACLQSGEGYTATADNFSTGMVMLKMLLGQLDPKSNVVEQYDQQFTRLQR